MSKKKPTCPQPDQAGEEEVRLASPEQVRGLPRPEAGKFVLADGRLALRWLDSRGGEVIRLTEGYLAHGGQRLATWLPEGWVMDTYPLGYELPHLERWFSLALSRVNVDDRPGIPAERPDGSPPHPSTPRGLVAHAHLIVRHLARPSSPSEPREPMDPAGCAADLRDTLGFFRRVLASPLLSSADRRPCYDRDHTWRRWADDEGLKPAGIRDRWNRENPEAMISKGQAGCDVVKKRLAAARRDKK
jgi:hypothetical protein